MLVRSLATVAAAARKRVRKGESPHDALRDVIEVLPFPALIANDAGEFVVVNRAAAELTGYTVKELLRLSVWQITPGVHEREAETLWRAFRQQREQIGRYRILTKKKRVVTAEYAARANVLRGFHLSLLQPDGVAL